MSEKAKQIMANGRSGARSAVSNWKHIWTEGKKNRILGRLGLLARLHSVPSLSLYSRFEINERSTACTECFLRGKSVISACFSGLYEILVCFFF